MTKMSELLPRGKGGKAKVKRLFMVLSSLSFDGEWWSTAVNQVTL